ncbi:MAG: SAM-dependent methyltransferase [Bacteroidales bacterium]|jgi:16S rRNA (cytidine1402-2'-O)-methyltransferase|nr:SAM-dependent methyltransferase [Bacteroidales bacterium]
MKFGTFYLIPSPLAESDFAKIFPAYNSEIIQEIDHFIVEDLRTGRRFVKKLGMQKPIESLHFSTLNEHTKGDGIETLLQPLKEGENLGLISDAGTPCIADPGSILVSRAQHLGIEVIPLIGPNSILLALMASGLNGQSFAFHGYLPREQPDRERQLGFLESLLKKSNQTQIFIETPYRNNHVFKSILSVCDPATRLCLGVNITADNQMIKTMTVKKWKTQQIDLHKQPTVFLLGR